MTGYYSWPLGAMCAQRGFHVHTYAGINTSATALPPLRCRDCGAILTPKTLPTTEDR